MRSILSERNIVVVLFVMVLVTFSLAHEDTKKMEQLHQGVNASSASVLQEWSGKQRISFTTDEKQANLPSTIR